jgi:hypothetical protein
MALVYGTRSWYESTPLGTTASFSHTQDAGSDRHLIVAIASPATGVAGVTYGGTSLTLADTQFSNYYGCYMSFWELDDAPAGNATVTATWSGGQYNKTSMNAFSFTGCSGTGNLSKNNVPTTNATTDTISVSQGSMFIGTGFGSGVSNEAIEVPQGTSITKLYTHNVNNSVWGAVSGALTADATMTWESYNLNNNSIMYGLEVQEATVTPTRRRLVLVT